jgi:hypothetical protein
MAACSHTSRITGGSPHLHNALACPSSVHMLFAHNLPSTRNQCLHLFCMLSKLTRPPSALLRALLGAIAAAA